MKSSILFLFLACHRVHVGGVIVYPVVTQTITGGALTLPTNTPWTSYLTFNQFNVPNATLLSIYIALAGGATSQINSTNNNNNNAATGHSYNQFTTSLVAACCSGKYAVSGTTVINSVNFNFQNGYQSAWDSAPITRTCQGFKTFNNPSPEDASFFTGNGTVSFIVTSQVMSGTTISNTKDGVYYSVTRSNMVPPTSYLTNARITYYYYYF